MHDPDLVQRAERAAIALERAWDRWRTMHGHGADPLPPVSSYVGYSLEEPWGQPRVVFGVHADEAEILADLLDGHDCGAPGLQDMSGRPDWQLQPDLEPLPVEPRPVRMPADLLNVPAQAPPLGADAGAGLLAAADDDFPPGAGFADDAGADAGEPEFDDNVELGPDLPLEPGPGQPGIVAFRLRPDESDSAPSQGPGYRGPRYQGQPPRYQPEPEPEPEEAEAPAGYAAAPVAQDPPRAKRTTRASHAAKLSRGSRKGGRDGNWRGQGGRPAADHAV